MDRKELKIQALLEKVSSLTTSYENQLADFRVEITILSQELQELKRAGEESPETDEKENPEADTD